MSDEFYGFDDDDFDCDESDDLDVCLHGVLMCEDCPLCDEADDEADGLL